MPCTAESDCSSIESQSTCVEGLPRPDEAAREEMEALRESCMPRRQRPDDDEDDDDDDDEQPRRRRPGFGGPRPDDDDEDDSAADDDDETPPEPFLADRRMCSIPPSYIVVSTFSDLQIVYQWH